MNPEQMFNDEELELLSNSHFFNLKAGITQKLSALLGELSESLEIIIKNISNNFTEEVRQSHPKISRGENYRGLPWMVLDYPRVFKQTDVFAFRSLCRWGHEFSFTLHVSGNYFDAIKNSLPAFLISLEKESIYICISDSPWHYHFEKENYILISELISVEKNLEKWIAHRTFIKLSSKTELQNYSNAPAYGIAFFRLLMEKLFPAQNN